jgi:ABC-2 type transport system ATP-binding protein
MSQKPVLRVHALTKIIKRKTIVDALTFDVFEGEVFGFLGPNGSGKTTTIRMLVDLIRPTSGTIEIDGTSLRGNHRKALSAVGCIVENPELYPYLTGYENMQHFAGMLAGIDDRRIAEVVEIVGLSQRIHERVKTYSLGMRQRLGIAQALLGRPKLLILDEPTNGLDPQGIKEMRQFIRTLAEQGISVFVSSHLLSEIQLLCDRVGIIRGGQLIAVGRVDQLLQHTGDTTVWDVAEPERAKQLFENEAGVIICEMAEEENVAATGMFVFTKHSESRTAELVRTLTTAGVAIHAVYRKRETLEDLFLRLTGSESIG